ncbi:sulfatase-like hydrolase/transferase [Horticoccus sp. 23ND18S-11]|uniref:sulfatase-like hydrolase/transferase n=1 Tax=Horticoccus sp. 23ND18S-11 TaxID=3391832 RepID=UPI0039C95BD1
MIPLPPAPTLPRIRLIVLACALGLAAWALPFNATAIAATANAAKPNIVFIMADDLGWADVAFHGGNAPTPHLDRLAREGLELAQHYVAPVCSPTRTGLLSGRCWSRFNITTPGNERAFSWDTVTLPRALKRVGYDTCLTGKWHLGSLPEQGPNHFGFDHSYGSLAGGVSPYSHRYKQGKFTQTWHRNETLIEEKGHVTDLIATEAIRWMESRGAAPFFLYVPFTAVHLPVKEPDEWVARVPAAITGDVARHYAASVMHLDDAVGRILAALEKSGRRENTLVVFTSDNGGSTVENNDRQYPDDQCPSGKLTGNNAPWRGQKGDLYEGGTRVATIVSWPGRVKPGRVDTPVHITDWMPTFSALAGFAPQTDLKWDGTDLTALLTTHTPLPPRPLYSVAPSWRSRSLRYESWKLIVFGEGAKSRSELFNLAADPGEKHDLAASEPQRLRQLRALMDAAAVRDRDALAKD